MSSIQDSDRKVAALGSDSKKDERGQGLGLVFLDLETAWNAKCPIFLGNITPKTSNFCLKNRALGFPGGDLFLIFWDTAIRSLTAS